MFRSATKRVIKKLQSVRHKVRDDDAVSCTNVLNTQENRRASVNISLILSEIICSQTAASQEMVDTPSVRDQLNWSEEELSQRKFVAFYRDRLPVLLLTTSGFSDGDNMNDIGADELYWVYAMNIQKRVIAKNENERYVSIPLNYKLKFERLYSRSSAPGKPMLLSEILSDGPCGQRIRLASKEPILFDFSLEGSTAVPSELGVLEVLDMYDEKYLLAHSLIDGELHPMVVGIPVYLPISLRVAEGFRAEGYDKAAFRQWIQVIENSTTDFDHATIPVSCGEILVFDRPPSGDYEYINPCKYARVAAGGAGGGKVAGKAGGAAGPKPRIPPPIDDDSDTDGDDYEKIRDDDSILLAGKETLQQASRPKERKDSAPTEAVKPVATPSLEIGKSKSAFKPHAAVFKPIVNPESHLAHVEHNKPNNPTGSAGKQPPKAHIKLKATPLPPTPLSQRAPLPPPSPDVQTSTSLPRSPRSTEKSSEQTSQVTPMSPTEDARKVTINGSSPRAQTSPSSISNSMRKHKEQPPIPTPANSTSTGTPTPASGKSTSNAPVMRVPPLSSVRYTDEIKAEERPDQKKPEADQPHRTSVGDELNWSRLQDVPLDFENFDVVQVVKCVELLGMPTIAVAFREQQVDGQFLVKAITEKILMEDFNCSEFLAIRLVMFAKGWRPK